LSPPNKDDDPSVVGPHLHSFKEIVFIGSGFGSHVADGEEIRAGPGRLAVMAPGMMHNPAGLQGASFWVMILNTQVLDADGWAGATGWERRRSR
jgi:hypothetical protein